ncbi:Hypothetical Protein FCC1311_055622 [Hondaea fermentalgiana]|uniref:Uncharacterized protein n=1 Tax=Hondaea fermentalgiana TaxID=2315210 RepID=A0A2R5GEG1_9STRA|nr:Hypothetical Protein FCC1311_055622 [Hondaea fermentalgiana]|eukprot:GBG29340.1 Hypothetical Protein FCC1311_055622 [Hondaea fermentalgiana]
MQRLRQDEDEYEEPYVRLLKEFLQGAEWQQSLSVFVSSHAKKFVGSRPAGASNSHAQELTRAPQGWDESNWENAHTPRGGEQKSASLLHFSHHQHGLFLTFQTWAEKMLASFITSLGVNEDELVAMLEARLQPGADTTPTLRAHIEELLDLVDSLQSFENFARWMELAYARLCRDDEAQARVLRAQLDMKEWDLQVALATSFVESARQGALIERDTELLPWAEAVLALYRAMDGLSLGTVTAEQIDELSESLVFERVKVEYLVAERLKGDLPPDPASVAAHGGRSSSTELGDDTREAETVLSRLLDASGKIQLAISRQRSAFEKDHPLLSDQDYQAIYFRVRDGFHGGALSPRLRSSLETEFRALQTDWTVLDGIVELVMLENVLQKVNHDIQLELQDPGSVVFQESSMPAVVLSGGAKERGLARNGSRLQIVTADEDLETMRRLSGFLQNSPVPSPKHPLAPGAVVTTPTEARRAIADMQARLNRITQQRELERMRKELEIQARAPGADMRKVKRLATRLAEMEAITLAENGESLNLQLQDLSAAFAGDHATHTDGFDDDLASDGTVDEGYIDDQGVHHAPFSAQDSTPSFAGGASGAQALNGKKRLGRLQIEADEPAHPGKLLRETERLRKDLLLRAVPAPYEPSATGGVLDRTQIMLNSPKSRSFASSPAHGLFPQSPKRDVIVNPTSLRFLASNVIGPRK